MDFYSKSRNLVIALGSRLIEFRNGKYSTDDKAIIEKLKKHKRYNTGGVGAFFGEPQQISQPEVIHGTRGAQTKEVAEYAKLFAEVVTEGRFKKNASKEKIEAFKSLYKEIFNEDFEVKDDDSGDDSDAGPKA